MRVCRFSTVTFGKHLQLRAVAGFAVRRGCVFVLQHSTLNFELIVTHGCSEVLPGTLSPGPPTAPRFPGSTFFWDPPHILLSLFSVPFHPLPWAAPRNSGVLCFTKKSSIWPSTHSVGWGPFLYIRHRQEAQGLRHVTFPLP